MWYISIFAVYSLNHVWHFCYPTDCSPPGSYVHGISQAGILPFPFPSSWPRDLTCLSCIGRWIIYLQVTRKAWYLYIVVAVYSLSHVNAFVTPWSVAHQTPQSIGFPRETPESVAISFYWIHISCIGRWILHHWGTRKAHISIDTHI